MDIRVFFIAATICLSFPAAADFKTVAPAYEVPLRGFTAPVTHNGVITFSECETCPKHSGRVTGETRFIVNGKDVQLKEFRKRISTVRDREEIVTVVHHLETDTIKKISISLRLK